MFPPTLIEKVYDLIIFLNGYIKEEKYLLSKHINVQYFQFVVLNDVPMMRYNELIRDIEWSKLVELWKMMIKADLNFPQGSNISYVPKRIVSI